MAVPPTSRAFWSFTPSEQWLLTAAAVSVGGFLIYIIHDAMMATAYELMQRLLVISPLLLVMAVHWLSSGCHVSIPLPGSEPGAIHKASGSPWGVAIVLLLLLFLISFQPSLLAFVF